MASRWSDQEVELLKDLSCKFQLQELSKIFNRSPHSVSYKLRSLGLTCLKARKEFNVRWTIEMLNQMKSMRDEGLSWEKVSKKVGKSRHACQRKYLRYFGAKGQIDFEKLEKELKLYFWDEIIAVEVLEIIKSCRN